MISEWTRDFWFVAAKRNNGNSPDLNKALGPGRELISENSPPEHKSFCGFLSEEEATEFCEKINKEFGPHYSVIPATAIIPFSNLNSNRTD